MNLLRRIYLLLLGLLLVIAVTLLLLSPQAVGTWVGSISELSPVVRLAVTIMIDLFLLVLMYLQVRPDPGSKVNGLVMRGSGAITEVSVESARDRILKAVSDVPDVVSVEASVKPVRGRADIEMQVTVFGHDVKLPSKQKEINRALRQVIDKQLGLQMAGQPRIHIRIHGEETQKPSMVVPPPAAIGETEKPVVPPSVTSPKVETVPEPKPIGGLLGGLGRAQEAEAVEVIKPRPGEPASAKPESESAASPLTGLFDRWRNRDDEDMDEPVLPVKSQPEQETDLPTPPLSSLLPESKPVVIVGEELVKTGTITADEDGVVKLDLDDELSESVVDDFADEEPDTDDIETDDPADTDNRS